MTQSMLYPGGEWVPGAATHPHSRQKMADHARKHAVDNRPETQQPPAGEPGAADNGTVMLDLSFGGTGTVSTPPGRTG